MSVPRPERSGENLSDSAGTAGVNIRPLQARDRDQWRALFQQYLLPTVYNERRGFYLTRPPESLLSVTFNRLVDPMRQPYAIVAVKSDRIVGFANYLFHPSSWSMTDVCYLEDLYVEATMRRVGVGRALVQGVYTAADAAHAGAVHWVTHQSNSAARALFESTAHCTGFLRYER